MSSPLLESVLSKLRGMRFNPYHYVGLLVENDGILEEVTGQAYERLPYADEVKFDISSTFTVHAVGLFKTKDDPDEKPHVIRFPAPREVISGDALTIQPFVIR